MIMFRIIGLSLAKAKQAVCIRAAWLSRQLVSRDHLSMTVVSKNSTLDSSLGFQVAGLYWIPVFAVFRIPQAKVTRNPHSFTWGASFAKSAVRELYVS